MQILKGDDYSTVLLNLQKIEHAVRKAILKKEVRGVVHLADELANQAKILKGWLEGEAERELQTMRGTDRSQG